MSNPIFGDITSLDLLNFDEMIWDDGGVAGFTLACESGSFTLSGTAVALIADRTFAIASGALSLAGTDISFANTVRINAESGVLTLSGTDVGFGRTYIFKTNSGTMAFAFGVGVTPSYGRFIDVDSGALELWADNLSLGKWDGVRKYGDWRDYKGLGPWTFVEQQPKWGYLNNPNWTETEENPVNYNANPEDEPVVWKMTGRKF